MMWQTDPITPIISIRVSPVGLSPSWIKIPESKYASNLTLTTAALVQPALVPAVWLAQRGAELGNNLFPCDGLVEVPNLKGPLRDQRLYVDFPSDSSVELLL